MPLLRNGQVSVDQWVHLEDDTPLPADGDVIVSFDRHSKERELLKHHSGRVGIAYPNDATVDELVPHLETVALVILLFPAFTDGRAYSQARSLRHQHKFAGEIRATGNVLPDQISLMYECGFDAFEIESERDLAAWQRVDASVTLSYQRGYGTRRQRPSHGDTPGNDGHSVP